MLRRSVLIRSGVLVAILAALLVTSATLAFAGPSGPTLGVATLQTKLNENSGSLDGYLKTVDKGSTIIDVPVHVLAVTTGYSDGPVDMSSLIYFKAYGPEIDSIGGIAAGMSGSPIYVTVDGEDKLIGALSYGDIFTTGGAGLATPIEAMAAMQGAYAAGALPRNLSSPVVVDGQTKDKVLIVTDSGKVASEPARTIVAKPLSSAYIGGMSPKSRMYQAAAKHLAKIGMDVIPLEGGLSAKESTYSAPFEGGSAVAALAARGDFWYGGIGTITYIDTSSPDATAVVAFGHPAFWEGETGLFLSNAWIDGVWPSTYEAYKLGRPAALRGMITQDRLEGIVGVEGQFPAETTITARAYNEQTGKIATSSVEVPRRVMNESSWDFYGLAAESAWIAGSRVFNAYTIPGSANTTTTVVVKDLDSSQVYTIVRVNRFSDPDDITIAAITDVNQIVSNFEDANGNGIAHADILSVDLDTVYHAARNEAEIVAIDVAGGLKTGDNTAKISLLRFGHTATETVNVKFSIPTGVPLTGDLTAEAVNNPYGDTYYSEMFGSYMEFDYEEGPTTDRRTVSDVVKEEREAADNTTIKVAFQPSLISSDSEDDEGSSSSSVDEFDPIEATATTAWSVRSSAEKVAPAITAYVDEDSYAYGDKASIYGDVTNVDSSGKITVSAADIPTVTITLKSGSFTWTTPTLRHTTTLHFTFAGDDDTLATQSDLVIEVVAKTTLKVSKSSIEKGKTVKLSAEVLPHNAGGKVSFQRWTGSVWSTLKSATLPSSGKVSWSYKPTKTGSLKLRAHYLGSGVAAAGNSKSVTVKVK